MKVYKVETIYYFPKAGNINDKYYFLIFEYN